MQLLKYSGLSIIFFSWGFLVVPYFLLRNEKTGTISQTVLRRGGGIVNFGLVGVGMSQILFALYLLFRYPAVVKISGVAIFVLGSLSILSSGIVSVRKNEKLHLQLAKAYVFLITLGTLIISLSFFEISRWGAHLAIVTTVLMVVGTTIFYLKGKIIFGEMWSIIFSTLWAIVVYTTIV